MPAQGAFPVFRRRRALEPWERRWRRWCSRGATRSTLRWRDALPVDAWIVAADSGLEHVHALGRHADLVVGDLDSVTPAALERGRRRNPRRAAPDDKDATDLELALDAAKRAGATRVTVVSAGGAARSLPGQRAPVRVARVGDVRAPRPRR